MLTRPDANQNVLNLEGAQHLRLRGLEITGGSAGIRISGANIRSDDDAEEIVVGIHIAHCHVHSVGGPAITANDPGVTYRACVFAFNHIHDTGGEGEGFYLGGNHGTAIFSGGVIYANYIHDLNGPNVRQGDGIEIKNGSNGNRIEANVIANTRYPGITVYGSEGRAINEIRRNLVWNSGDHGIQVAADALVRQNTVLGSRHDGIHVQPHQAAHPANLTIESNVIFGSAGAAVRIRDEGQRPNRSPIVIRHNQWPTIGTAVRLEPADIAAVKDNRRIDSSSGPNRRSLQWSKPDWDIDHPASLLFDLDAFELALRRSVDTMRAAEKN